MKWYLREIFGVLAAIVIAVGLLIYAFDEASATPSGDTVLWLGLLGGAIPIMLEFFIAWRRNELFIRDKAKIASKQARNRKLARIFFAPAVVLGVVFTKYSGSAKVAYLALLAGYLLPFSVFLVVHFLKNHKEIKRLTENLNQ